LSDTFYLFLSSAQIMGRAIHVDHVRDYKHRKDKETGVCAICLCGCRLCSPVRSACSFFHLPPAGRCRLRLPSPGWPSKPVCMFAPFAQRSHKLCAQRPGRKPTQRHRRRVRTATATTTGTARTRRPTGSPHQKSIITATAAQRAPKPLRAANQPTPPR